MKQIEASQAAVTTVAVEKNGKPVSVNCGTQDSKRRVTP
jgi:hypothetical protein